MCVRVCVFTHVLVAYVNWFVRQTIGCGWLAGWLRFADEFIIHHSGLGGGTAFDLRRTVTTTSTSSVSRATAPATESAPQAAMLSSAQGCGFQTVLAGAYGGPLDVWTKLPTVTVRVVFVCGGFGTESRYFPCRR